MMHMILHDYSKKRMSKFLKMFNAVPLQFIFNVRPFANTTTIRKCFKPDYIMALLFPLYKDTPIIIEVTEFIGRGAIDSYGIKYVIKSDMLPSIQIIFYKNYGITLNSYTIRCSDTMIASDEIYREHVGKDNDMNLVLTDCKILGFAKAKRIIPICQTCEYFNEESFYIRCAVNPNVDHESLKECRDYTKAFKLLAY